MIMHGTRRSMLFFVFVVVAFLSCQNQSKVTIYRDTWGVPHIYGSSDEAVAFGLGYVQAEDRMEQLMSTYRWATGSLAEVMGSQFVESDYVMRVWQQEQISRDRYHELPTHLRRILEAFVRGIHLYMKEHPDRVPEWAIDVKPWHPVALGRAFIWWWPLDQALDDLKAGLRQKAHTHGSNQWAVAGSRTASGAPILLIDPHLSWNKDGHWYEARLHGDKLHVSGIIVVGTPFIALGHNRHLAWAATTGGPDCGDVYEEEINPDNHLQYKYDGKWRNMRTDTIRISVKSDTGVVTIQRIVERTHHGPIQQRRGLKAYAIALPYEQEISLVTQMYRMNVAENLKQFKEALALRQFMPQNIMVADQDGNIYYQRTGRVPIRDIKYDWSRPVPGNTHDTEWKGIHPTSDLVQILNPDNGFMQNCNISPGTMFPSSPMVQGKYPVYIFNDRNDRSNPRGKRAIRLLSEEKRMSFERAQEIAVDTGIEDVGGWVRTLSQAFERFRSRFRDVEGAVALIVNWDGHLDRDSKGATMYRYWRRALQSMGTTTLPQQKSLTRRQMVELLKAVRKAKVNLTSQFGTYQVPWGTTVVLERGKKKFPLDGGSFENGLSALRAVWGSSKDGVTYAMGGQSGTMVVSLTKPIRSVGVLPWGVSDDSASKHFDDQAEKLFSQRKLKPTWFEMDDLKGHIESQKVLPYSR